MHLGLQIRRPYPQGLHIIAIPYQKLDEVVAALNEMEHVPLELLTDAGSQAKSLQLHTRLDVLAADINVPNRL
jgi:hypothetical protein